jgi:hypothetical protein
MRRLGIGFYFLEGLEETVKLEGNTVNPDNAK